MSNCLFQSPLSASSSWQRRLLEPSLQKTSLASILLFYCLPTGMVCVDRTLATDVYTGEKMFKEQRLNLEQAIAATVLAWLAAWLVIGA